MTPASTAGATELVIATRRSPLALAQAESVAALLRAAGHSVRLLEIVTAGDRWSADGRTGRPDKGAFVTELERALLEGRADIAVHSAKDLPAVLPDGLEISGVPPRADPRDVVVGARGGLMALVAGARVATGSPRRREQLRLLRPDIEIVGIRGNVGTRLAKLAAGEADALVLAAAGLARLGLTPDDTAPLPFELCTPAPGQGYLALEARPGTAAAAAAAALTDPTDRACLMAERGVLREMGGGCLAPIGAVCEADTTGGLTLTAYCADSIPGEDGVRVVRHGQIGDPDGLAAAAAIGLRGEDRETEWVV